MGVIKGLDEIKAKLKGLEEKIVSNINRSAANAGATALRKEAQNNLNPKHKKKLGQQRSRRLSKRAGYDVYSVGPLAEHWQLTFLEYGAAPHDISIKTKKILAVTETSKRSGGSTIDFIGTTVKHPGITPTHFLSRALSEGQEKAFEAIRKQYWKRIEKAVK
jgi:HK97 gp10 family phage protein